MGRRLFLFPVVIRRTRKGYTAEPLGLDGCTATGMTAEHTRHRMWRVLHRRLAAMRQGGEPLPDPPKEVAFRSEGGREVFCTWVGVADPGMPPDAGRGV